MNTPEPSNITTVTAEDVALVAKELARSVRPLALHALAETLAFVKTAGQRTRDVKKYDPYAVYEIGDIILKEYDETLTIGNRATEHFKGSVILKVVAKSHYKNFNCEMLEVDYTGGGHFRKYIDYMKKTKTQVLIPSNLDGRAQTSEILDKGSDPRLTELPMTERDLRILEKNLHSELVKNAEFFSWNDLWQLTAKKAEIPDDKIKEIEAEFEKTRASETTENLVEKILGVDTSNERFELMCLSLNVHLDKKHKKDFILLSPAGWGRWHLKRILTAMPKGLPLDSAMARLPDEFEVIEKPEMSIVQEFPIKIYLTWREILSGGIKIPRSLTKGLSHFREYTFMEPDEGLTYTLHYFPSAGIFLGLGDFYARHNIPQGTSLTLEKKGPAVFHFWVKKSKKKISSVKVEYDAKSDRFSETPEDVFTFAEPNKIIHIERETLAALLPLYDQRDDLDLKDLLVLVFKNPALSSPSHAIHFLRATHLVDVLKQTTQEDVETVLLNTTEFSMSEKKKGIFIYKEPYKDLEEALEKEAAAEPVEETEETVERAAGETYLPPGTVGFEEEEEEDIFPEGEIEIIDLTPKAPAPPQEPSRVEGKISQAGEPAEPAAPPTPQDKEKAKAAAKKEKPQKKKKAKLEGEKGPRPKKSERRVIEEKLVEEESELEALAAVKEQDEEIEEQRLRLEREKKEKLEKEKKEVAKEEPKFGIFGDLLKTALKKEKPKEEEKPEKKPEKGSEKKEAAPKKTKKK
jgi:hypothetical protein